MIRNYEDLPWTGNLPDVDTGGGLQQFEMHHMRRVIAQHLTLGDVDTVRQAPSSTSLQPCCGTDAEVETSM